MVEEGLLDKFKTPCHGGFFLPNLIKKPIVEYVPYSNPAKAILIIV